MMMRMRGRSTIFAKYCRKRITSGSSRQCSSSSSNNNNNNSVRKFKTLDEAVRAVPRLLARQISYTLESLAFKSVYFYLGYQVGTHDPTYYPEKYDSEIEELSAKRQELEKKKEALLAKKMQISNPV